MTVKIKVNNAAVVVLMKSPEVQADLMARAQRIATAAGPGMEASSMVGLNRARASVITATSEARRAEAKSRRLSAALDAGR